MVAGGAAADGSGCVIGNAHSTVGAGKAETRVVGRVVSIIGGV